MLPRRRGIGGSVDIDRGLCIEYYVREHTEASREFEVSSGSLRFSIWASLVQSPASARRVLESIASYRA